MKMKTVMVYSKSVNLKEFNFLNSNSFKSITFTYLLQESTTNMFGMPLMK